jgi:hypothetical protein
MIGTGLDLRMIYEVDEAAWLFLCVSILRIIERYSALEAVKAQRMLM